MSDRYQPPSQETLRWVEETLGSRARVGAVSRLYGGLTADMDRLRISARSGCHDVVLRRWPTGEWFSGLVDREAAALTALSALDGPALRAPQLLGADRAGTESGQPSLLMTALDGRPLLVQDEFPDQLPQLVQALVRIHAIDPGDLAPTDPHPPQPARERGWIKDAELATAAERVATRAKVQSAAVFVHGDYQPFNLLWRDRRMTGIVDWTYAGRGWREIDVGLCRQALAVLYSPDVAEMFLHAYETEAGVRIDPALDVRAQLSFYEPHWHQLARQAQTDTADISNRAETLLRLTHARLT